jgi:hypothetical protein
MVFALLLATYILASDLLIKKNILASDSSHPKRTQLEAWCSPFPCRDFFSLLIKILNLTAGCS